MMAKQGGILLRMRGTFEFGGLFTIIDSSQGHPTTVFCKYLFEEANIA